MAAIDVTLRIGMTRSLGAWSGVVPDHLIEHFQDTSAEFEVLEMALHDSHYGRGQMGALSVSPYRMSAPFAPAVERVASSDVVGNIGEGIGIATLCSMSGFQQSEISRIRRQRQRQSSVARRTPDFAICVGTPGAVVARLSHLGTHVGISTRKNYTAAIGQFPDRFPVESKASSSECNTQWSAVWQLIEYWHTQQQFNAQSVGLGCGMIVETSDVGTTKRAVRLTVLAPKDPIAFGQRLQRLVDPRGTKRAFMMQFASMSVFHGD